MSLKIIEKLERDPGVKSVSQTCTLPSGFSCKITDFRTRSHIDDIYYRKTKSLLLRRGLAAVYPADANSPIHLLAGLPKFGNEDETFTQKLPESCGNVLKRIYMVKENGEAGHLAFFKEPKQSKWYCIVGSKNVHIVLSVHSQQEYEADLAYYENQKAQRLSCAIANAKLLLRLESRNLFENAEIREYLRGNGLTLVFEAIFDNHIVSYGEQAVIAFALTQPQQESLEIQGLCLNPELSLKLLANWGFRIPNHDFVEESNNYYTMDQKYEQLKNSEGAVVYEIFENPITGIHIVGRIYKHKNHVYVIRRMARELIKRRASFITWQRRFRNSHIPIDGDLKVEADMLLAFYVWLSDTKNKLFKNEVNWSEMVQQNFKQWLNDFQCLFEDDFSDLLKQAPLALKPVQGEQNSEILAIVLIGLQGSGKTLLRNSLIEALGGPAKVAHVNQDELGGDRKAFLRELRDAKKSKDKICIVVDKCNHLAKLREDVYQNYTKCLLCEFVCDDAAKMIDILEQRIQKRGINHLTLPFSQHARWVIDKISEDFEPVTDTEKFANDYLALNLESRPEVNLKAVLDYLQSNGHVLKPELDDLSQLAVLVQNAEKSYEDRIKKMALKKVLYWRASAEIKTIKQLFQSIVPNSNTIRYKCNLNQNENSHNWSTEEYHVTLAFDKKMTEREIDDKFLSNVNIRVKAFALAFNDQCVAVRVRSDEGRLEALCQNTFPHITLGTVAGVKPFYANEMLESGIFEQIDCDFELNLVINPCFITK